jgi:multidrug efflux pump subunit AcrA (membrane-fusion protein)
MRAQDDHSLDRPSSLLPTHPPARVARWAGWLLLGVIVTTGVFACVIKLPEVVSAPFILVPEEGTDPTQAPLAAEVASVRVREGQRVQAGEELFTLRSDDIRNWQTRLRQLQEDQLSLGERTKKLEEAHSTELEIKNSEIVQADREIEFREQYRAASSNLLDAVQTLGKEKLISQFEIIHDQLDLASSEKDLVLGEKDRQKLLLQRQELETIRARERVEEAAEGEKFKTQIVTLQQELEHCTGDVKSVCAPYDAFVLSVSQHNAGNMVAAGTELCQLARANSRPTVRLFLPEAGLPRLLAGQTLRLRFVAFPYQRYGTFPAQLDWVSPAAVNGPTGPCFEGRATIVLIGTQNKINPVIGMRGEARIVVGRQTLLEKALEPFKMLRENTKTGL